jgi:heme oxygenase (biliverdin-IX-beta and delta-forming)
LVKKFACKRLFLNFTIMPLTISAAQIAQAVKQNTAALHAEVEAILVPKLNKIRSIEDYSAVLRLFYGYFHPLEQRILQYITPAVLPDIAERRTSHLIINDLAVLNARQEFLICSSLPQINNADQAFGALYVLEGSTLGGKVIAKMLAKNTSVAIPAEAMQFFNGYREETGRMWASFVNVLNQQKNEPEISAAANETFFYLKDWMQSLPE